MSAETEDDPTHVKVGKEGWTVTQDGKYEIKVIKRTRCGVLAHVRARIDKESPEAVESEHTQSE